MAGPVLNAPVESASRAVEAEVLAPQARVLPLHEKLVFRVKWLGLTAGELVSEIKGIEDLNGRKAYRIEVTARTLGFTSTIYRIDDHYVSHLDVETLVTLRHEVHRREGSYKKDAVIDFDQVAHKAYFKSQTDGTSKVIDIPPETHDTVTAAYVARLLPLTPGKFFEMKVLNSEKVYDLFVAVPEKAQRAIASRPRAPYLTIKPYAKTSGQEVREGSLSGFVTDDAHRDPVLVVIKAPVFTSLVAQLMSVAREQPP
ncbi:MAG: DUF3108 domain-containing protein [Candidatus Omnitrophica bacterium]|nr:DUF3108 domain-containing protein [Candidatus Omnitrophota bacterium]